MEQLYCAPYANVLRHCQIPNARVLQRVNLKELIEVKRSQLPDDLKDILFHRATGEELEYIPIIHSQFLEDMRKEEMSCRKRRVKKDENGSE